MSDQVEDQTSLKVSIQIKNAHSINAPLLISDVYGEQLFLNCCFQLLIFIFEFKLKVVNETFRR